MTSSSLFLAILVPLTLVSPRAPLAQTPAPAPAETPVTKSRTRDLGPLIAPLREKGALPGVVAAVVEDGELVALGASGVRMRGDPTPITVDDPMHLGSCTKAMTATLAARFVEAGKLRWNSTLAELFPDVEMLPAWRAVTVEQLLSHRGGAPKELDAGGLWSRLWKEKGTHVEQRRELLVGVVKREPVFAPGTGFEYSNAGVAIVGHALETLAKKPWEELMQEELFAPLGITTGGFGAPGTKGVVDAPRGHAGKRSYEPGPSADNPPAIGPAGTAHMKIADWAKFVAVHLEAAHARLVPAGANSASAPSSGARPFLTSESFAKLQTVPEGAKERYALGWMVGEREWAGGEVLTHSGSNTMWFCVTWLAPKQDFAVLVCCNAGGDDVAKTIDGIAWAVIQDEVARRAK